jgi:cell division protein FtsI (penicillin-binding protein 3)
MRHSFRLARPRLAFLSGFFLLIFLAIGLRAFYLQILQGDDFRRRGERQHLKESILLPKRGSIYDRAGEPLAVSVEAQSIYVRPRRLKEPETIARILAQPLALNPLKLEHSIRTEKPFVWIKRQITPKEAEKIKALELDGVGLSYEPSRYYPQGVLAGQVIGFVSRDSEGLEGVELQYDEYIRGESASSIVERDALGRRVLIQGVEEVQIPPGADVHLTLDTAIQHLTERELEGAVKKFRAKAGVAVVADPATGEVLALANYPAFDPNKFTAVSSREWRNRAVTDSYEPGSTFKTILAAAALEEAVVGKEDLFFCEFGRYPFAGKVIHDTHKYGWIPFSKIIQFSSNIGATKIAEKLKKDRYFSYIEKFGFGQKTGIDLPGEVAGMVRSPNQWAAIDLATHAFGQGIAVTPLQLTMAYAAIANGGFLMRPYTVRKVTAQNGEVLTENQPHVVRRVVSEKTARLLTNVLKGVVTDGGTGIMARVEGFEVAGKTGTSQKPDPVHGGYSANKRVASFVGFVPADDPRLVLLVIVDEPEVNIYGGIVAAPAFQNIARAALRRLGIVPDKPEPLPIPALAQPVSYDRDGTVPKEALQKKEGETEIPDFVGLSLRQAITKAKSLNVPVEFRGFGYVVKQSPAPGIAPVKGEKVVLILQG